MDSGRSIAVVVAIFFDDNGLVPISVISVFLDDNGLITLTIAVAIVIRAYRYANGSNTDFFGAGGQRAAAHTRGDGDYQYKSTNHRNILSSSPLKWQSWAITFVPI
jgi:hypothetical protein